VRSTSENSGSSALYRRPLTGAPSSCPGHSL